VTIKGTIVIRLCNKILAHVENVKVALTAQQTLDRQQDGAHIVDSRPLVLQYVQADVTILIYIRVITRCFKANSGSCEWIVGRELERQFESQVLVGLESRLVLSVIIQKGVVLTVPATPLMVPIHLNKLSPSGNAEISPDPDPVYTRLDRCK
jgi:hypothetical protein